MIDLWRCSMGHVYNSKNETVAFYLEKSEGNLAQTLVREHNAAQRKLVEECAQVAEDDAEYGTANCIRQLVKP